MFTPTILYKGDFEYKDITITTEGVPEYKISEKMEEVVSQLWVNLKEDFARKGTEIRDGVFYRVSNIEELKISNNLPLDLKLNHLNYRHIRAARFNKEYFTSDPNVYPNHLSVATMIETSDGKYVFGQRSRDGSIDLIGGGAQPEEFSLSNGDDLRLTALKEIKEEIGLNTGQIDTMDPIGLVYAASSNTCLISSAKLNIDSEELKRVFQQRSDDEMKDLLFLEGSEIDKMLDSMGSYWQLIPELMK